MVRGRVARRKPSWLRTVVALAAAGFIQLGFLVVLMTSIEVRRFLEPRTIELHLVSSPTETRSPRHDRAGRRHPSAERRQPRAGGSAIRADAGDAVPSPGAPAATRDTSESPATLGGDQRLREALRATVGCSYAAAMRLTAEEKAACAKLERLRGRGYESAAFGVDPNKQAAFDAASKFDAPWAQPFLVERPKNGCRPRVTEENLQPRSGGTVRNWTTGVLCAVPF